MSTPAHPSPASAAERTGWAVLPLFTPDTWDDLDKRLKSLLSQQADARSNKALADMVDADLLPALARAMEGQRLVSINYTPAAPVTHLQQLPCITDEAAHRAYRLWLPLEACTLGVVPRSHRWSNALRGEGLPSIWRALDAELGRLAVPIPVASGSAVLFDRALMHQMPGVAGIALDWAATAAPLRCYQHAPQQPDSELIACFSYASEMEVAPGDLLGHLRQNLDPVRPQDLQALRMGILPAIYRPIQDPDLLQSIPKAGPGFSKR